MLQSKRDYILKLYDMPLISFSTEISKLGTRTTRIKEIDEKYRHLFPMPLIHGLDGEKLENWLESRTIPKNRQFVEQILATAGLSVGDTFGILDVCKGLSVNDSFWVVPEGDTQTYDEANLYENPLDETLALVAYTGYSSTQKHRLGLSGEWTTDGQFPKAWRRKDDRLYLFKGGSEGFANAGMEPYSEFLAFQLAAAMGVNAVSYDLEMWKDKLASVCPLMNHKDTAFVPFWAAAGESHFPRTLAVAGEATAEIFEAFRTMAVFDALICNVDRHANNYGFFRDNQTGRVTGFAPLFDHNLSLFCRDMESDFGNWEERANTVMLPRTGNLSFYGECENVMGEMQHELLRKVLGFQFHNHPRYPIPESRLEALNRYIRNRCMELLRIPVVNEQELRRMLAEEAGRREGVVPLLELLDR